MPFIQLVLGVQALGGGHFTGWLPIQPVALGVLQDVAQVLAAGSMPAQGFVYDPFGVKGIVAQQVVDVLDDSEFEGKVVTPGRGLLLEPFS